jgi:hypothetical protein
MSESGVNTKKREFVRDCVDFIFGFENKRGDILDHWITFSDAFVVPPQEFYDAIEKEMAARKIPSMEISREEFAEGGMLSDKRLYLRLFRERLAILTCASPFGSGYFFSCRTVYIPALIRLWHLLALIVLWSVLGGLLVLLLGTTYAIIALVTLLFAIAATLRNAGSGAFSDLDSLLLKIPVISTVYEQWFRDETYYRTDTRIVYLQRLPALIKELAEDSAAAKGAKLGQQYELQPILGDLYKRVPPRKAEPEKEA